MKPETGLLNTRQEVLMDFLWKNDTPLTANEMADILADKGWNSVTLFKTVQTLEENGFLRVTGIVKSGKAYARKMAPSMSKAQYYGFLLEKRNIKIEDIPEIIAHIIGKSDSQEVEKMAAIETVLKNLLNQLS